MDNDKALRVELVNLLTKKQAHADFKEAVADFPEEHFNTVPPGCRYSFWQLLEHLRLAQKDILDYITADAYTWPTFPDDYWPDASTETDREGWQQSVNAFLADRQNLVDLIERPETDLFAPLPNSGERNHNILREIHIAASHNAYHTGAFILMRQTMGIWG